MESEKLSLYKGVRVGPAGQGKFYTQTHGDTMYNRKKVEEESRREIEEGLEGTSEESNEDNSIDGAL